MWLMAFRSGKLTAEGLYLAGKVGLDVSTVTIKAVVDGGKVLVVTTEKEAEVTYQVTNKALTEIAKATVKGAKVVVYSSSKGGMKVAHFFESLV